MQELWLKKGGGGGEGGLIREGGAYSRDSTVYSQLHLRKLDIVMIKIDFVSYYHLHQMVPFLI